MATPSWMESTLRRSASMGREVLERASRRSVDWTTRTFSSEKKHTLDEAFAAIADLMAHTTCQCKKFYESGGCTELSDAERNHMSRFHRRPSPRTRTSAQRKNNGGKSAADENYLIEVSPGTYAVSAGLPESQQQTRMVRINAGDSIDLTFDL